MFYPNWPIWKYPKKYEVRNVTDYDFCEKEFNKHNDFSFGVFSVGCMCPYNITMGYELMLCKESAHNIFILLMCRDANMHALKGVVFDFACGLDQYMLNREPVEFEYLRLLVDGAHWQVDIRIIQCCHLEENLYQGQKKLKRPDRSGRGGHIGCSDGFNYNLYKPFLPYKQPNSQVSSLHLIFVLWFCTFTGKRADACQVRQAVSQLEANGLLGLYAFSQSVFWIFKLKKQRHYLVRTLK